MAKKEENRQRLFRCFANHHNRYLSRYILLFLFFFNTKFSRTIYSVHLFMLRSAMALLQGLHGRKLRAWLLWVLSLPPLKFEFASSFWILVLLFAVYLICKAVSIEVCVCLLRVFVSKFNVSMIFCSDVEASSAPVRKQQLLKIGSGCFCSVSLACVAILRNLRTLIARSRSLSYLAPDTVELHEILTLCHALDCLDTASTLRSQQLGCLQQLRNQVHLISLSSFPLASRSFTLSRSAYSKSVLWMHGWILTINSNYKITSEYCKLDFVQPLRHLALEGISWLLFSCGQKERYPAFKCPTDFMDVNRYSFNSVLFFDKIFKFK